MLTNSKDLNDPNELYRYLDVKKDLVTGFSILFSRFEYALKRTGYCQRNCDEAKPDWDTFAQDFDKLFKAQKDPKLETAVQYLLSCPPKKQIQKNGKLEWQFPVAENKDKQLKQILRLVRRVRNNLFHGGKFPSGHVDDPARDTNLLENCITILQECISLRRDIQNFVWQKD